MTIDSFPKIHPFIIKMTLDELYELKDFIIASIDEKLADQIDELEDQILVLREKLRELSKERERSET